ncbi:MAG: PaaI family thioesterase [Bacteroidetes bacterium]|nr:MAG: PaaI family thioesterase [Bacteroidota bacterium]
MIVSPEVAKQFMEQTVPLHKFLGMTVLEIRDGYCKMRFPFREEVMGDFRAKRWHGGIIATALDSVGGAAAATTLTSFEDKLATIDMRIDYLRGSGPSDLVVIGKLIRNGNRVIATDMEAWQENEEKLVATGRAMYSVYRKQGLDPGEQFSL